MSTTVSSGVLFLPLKNNKKKKNREGRLRVAPHHQVRSPQNVSRYEIGKPQEPTLEASGQATALAVHRSAHPVRLHQRAWHPWLCAPHATNAFKPTSTRHLREKPAKAANGHGLGYREFVVNVFFFFFLLPSYQKCPKIAQNATSIAV